MGKLIDITGGKYGLLTVIGRAGSSKQKRALWSVECECGNTAVVNGHDLRNGHTKSCGCKKLSGFAGQWVKGQIRTSNPSYRTMHLRLARHAPATNFACVDCGGKANEWSYDHQDPDELKEVWGRYPVSYSIKLDHYQPRCVPCHRTYDAAA